MFRTDTDYIKEEFPSGACILDYLRCSITFKTPKELLDAVEYLIDEIENNKIESLSKILRIKNGFENILKWDGNNISDYNYVDLKMNVIFNNKDKRESQIVEIQFLLDFLLYAKKIGHKYYGIKRKDVEIHSVCNIMYNTNNNCEKYKNKILGMINGKNVSQLASHLFLRPNCILSMIGDKERHESRPYLFSIGYIRDFKMYELFLDCLFHFGQVLLNEKKPKNYNIGIYDNYSTRPDKEEEEEEETDNILSKQQLFVEKYLNFSLGDSPCINPYYFVKCCTL